MAANALEKLNTHYSTAAKLTEIAVAPSHALDVLSEKPTPINLFAATNAVMRKVRRTYKYKLYRSRRNRKLHRQINAAAMAHNHIIALHRRYYGLFKKSLNLYAVLLHRVEV